MTPADPRRAASTSALALVLLLLLPAPHAAAQGFSIWSGIGGDDNWFNTLNWIGGVPSGTGFASVGSPAPTFVNGNGNVNTLSVQEDGQLIIPAARQLVVGVNGGDANSNGLINWGTVRVEGSSNLLSRSTGMFNSGTIRVGSGNPGAGLLYSLRGISIDGGGTIQLDGGELNSFFELDVSPAGNSLTLTDQRIVGHGDIQFFLVRNFNIAEGSSVTATSPGQSLQIGRDSSSGSVTNRGVLAAAGGTLVLNAVDNGYDNYDGLIGGIGSDVVLNNRVRIRGGTLGGFSGGAVVTADGSITALQDVRNTGLLKIGGRAILRTSGTLENSGTIQVPSNPAVRSELALEADTTLTGGGTIELSGQNAMITSDNSKTLVVENQTLRGAGLISGVRLDARADSRIIADTGVLQVLPELGGGPVIARGELGAYNPGSYLGISDRVIVAATGRLVGDASIDVLLMRVDGTVDPGDEQGNPGTLTLRSSLTLTESAVADFLVADNGIDRLDVAGGLRLDGELSISKATAFPIDPVITLITSTSLDGTFDNVLNGQRLELGNPSSPTDFFFVHYGPDSLYNPNHVVLTNFIPEPTTAGLLLIAAPALLLRRRSPRERR